MFGLIFFFLVETVAIKRSSLARTTQAEPMDDADFLIWAYMGSLPVVPVCSNTLNLYANKQEKKKITRGNGCPASVHVNAYEAVFAIYLKLLRMRACVRPSPRVHLRVAPCVCAWIFQLEESVHVHYIRQSARGVPQRVCAAVCSELSAPAGSAIPIYPSAAEAGGKSAGHHCRRFHIRGTRLPVRGPL